MKQLRTVRIVLAALFFAASLACLVLGPRVNPMARLAGGSQIMLSAISVTLGATLVWLLATFLFGRVYCSTVCPVGTLSDIFLLCRRAIPRLRRRTFRYRPRSRASVHVLWIYLLCTVVGLLAVPFAIEPWNIMRNIVAVFHPSAVEATWISIGLGAATGIAAGVVSLVLIAVSSIWFGREFCSRYCPIGTAMGMLGDQTVWHIEIDPDRCTSCGLCEEICRSQCVKVAGRLVDNGRCVRCFDCVARCPEGAIRFQPNRNRPATPLMRRKEFKV